MSYGGCGRCFRVWNNQLLRLQNWMPLFSGLLADIGGCIHTYLGRSDCHPQNLLEYWMVPCAIPPFFEGELICMLMGVRTTAGFFEDLWCYAS
jgi:hypothetical protein